MTNNNSLLLQHLHNHKNIYRQILARFLTKLTAERNFRLFSHHQLVSSKSLPQSTHPLPTLHNYNKIITIKLISPSVSNDKTHTHTHKALPSMWQVSTNGERYLFLTKLLHCNLTHIQKHKYQLITQNNKISTQKKKENPSRNAHLKGVSLTLQFNHYRSIHAVQTKSMLYIITLQINKL